MNTSNTLIASPSKPTLMPAFPSASTTNHAATPRVLEFDAMVTVPNEQKMMSTKIYTVDEKTKIIYMKNRRTKYARDHPKIV